MASVAAEVGVHRATLYRHFPTREALIARLAARATAEGRELVAEIASERPSLSGVKRLSDAITEFGDRYRFLIGTAPVLNTGTDPIGLAGPTCVLAGKRLEYCATTCHLNGLRQPSRLWQSRYARTLDPCRSI